MSAFLGTTLGPLIAAPLLAYFGWTTSPDRYSALGFAYALAAVVAGFVPYLTAELGVATGNAWWHPAIVLAGMSLITLVSSLVAIRIRVDRDEDAPAVTAPEVVGAER